MLNIEIEASAILIAVCSNTCYVNIRLIAGIYGEIRAVCFPIRYGMGVGQADNLVKHI